MAHGAQLAEVPRESEISIGVVRGFCGLVEQTGVSRDALLRAANFELATFESADARVPRSLVYQLSETAIELTGDAALGLHWSERLCGHSFTPISNLMAHAPTLRAAFDTVSRFHRLITDQMGYDVIEHEDRVTLRSCPLTGESARVQRFVAEMLVSSMFKVIRAFGVPLQASQVSFDYAPPPYHSEYQRVFEGKVSFDQPYSGIVFDREYMDAASPHRDEDVHDALRSIAERRILRLTERTTWAERVRDVLVQRESAGPIGMEEVANILGISVRSLRRRLSAEGVSYKSVMNEAFAITAQHLLRTTRRTIQEIAFDLGFAETSAFHRAFKRRTGMTPQQYRSEQFAG